MEIFGADLRGIEGELIRFRVLGEREARGVTLLGNARTVTTRGTIERCLNAIHTLEGFSHVGGELRYVIDLSPVEAKVQSPGVDLPLAISILRATVLQNLDDLRDAIAKSEEQLKVLDQALAKPGADLARRQTRRKAYLEQLADLRQSLKYSMEYKAKISSNPTEYLLIGKLDITTGAIESPRDGMLGLISASGKRPGMTIIVPDDAEVHAHVVAAGQDGTTTFKARDLAEVWRILTQQARGRPCRTSAAAIRTKHIRGDGQVPDLRDIEGNSRAKAALEIALAGRHSLLLLGPQGQGKSMLAKAATRLLPDLEKEELLEVNKIYSARGELDANELVLRRPYQEVSSGVTEAALFGGSSGASTIRPGLISAAHKGILFFDEVNLAEESVLEQLRAPWENGYYAIQRAGIAVTLPAGFQFIGAMNPCHCGERFLRRCSLCPRVLFGEQTCDEHPTAPRTELCRCTPAEVRRYLGRLSGPIKDRIGMVCLVSRFDQQDLGRTDWSTRTVAQRIKAARQRQRERHSSVGGICNGEIGSVWGMKKVGSITTETVEMLVELLQVEFGLEARSLRKRDQLVCLARTLADLDESKRVEKRHLRKAVNVSGLQEGLLD